MAKADRLSPAAVKLLQEPQIAHVATVLADGAPQVTPVWVDVEDDGSIVLINTAEGNLKTNNIAQNPEIAIRVVDRQDPYRIVTLRGTVIERTVEGANAHIDKLAQKYLGQPIYPWHSPDSTRTIWRIKPHHVIERGV